MGKNIFKAKIVVLLLAWLSIVLELFAIYTFKDMIFQKRFVISLLCQLASLVSYVILALYFTIGYPNGKYHSMLPITIGLFAIPYLANVFTALSNLIQHHYPDCLMMLFDIITLIMLGFILIHILSGENKKILIIMILVMIVLLFYGLLSFYGLSSFVTLPRITFFAALLVFLLKNRIYPIIDTVPEKSVTPESNTMSAQDLRKLKAMLDKGQITEEQYQNARADIINKL